MKILKLDQIHALDKLHLIIGNLQTQTNIRIDKKLIKKISKKYQNYIENMVSDTKYLKFSEKQKISWKQNL